MQGSRIAEQVQDSSIPLLTGWRLPGEELSMPEKIQGLHLWLIELDQADASFLSLLSTDELSRREGFASQDDARRYAVARGAMRSILGKYLDTSGNNLEFAYGPLGKPEIRQPSCDLHFNLSHAGDKALLAFRSDSPVGVDLEPIRPRTNIRKIADRIFDRETAQELYGLEGEQLLCAFLCRWTKLEARVKTLGKGVFNTDTGALPCLGFQPAEGWIGAVASTPDLPRLDNWALFRFQ